MGSSGSAQQPVQTTQTSTPWSGAQPHLTDTMQFARNYIDQDRGYQPYTGQTQADVNPYFSTGWNMAYSKANSEPYGGPGLRAALGLSTDMITNRGLSPELKSLYEMQKGTQNPYLQSILDTSNRRISDKIGSSMSGAGRYGSGQHTDVAARAMAEAADPILAQDYQARQEMQNQILTGGLERAGKFAELVPGQEQAQYASADRLMGLGQYYQDRDQASINNMMSVWNAQQARPWEQLNRYNAIISGMGGLGGTKVMTSPSTAPPLSNRILGGALAGAGMGGSMFGAPGAGIGALGGGLLGLL